MLRSLALALLLTQAEAGLARPSWTLGRVHGQPGASPYNEVVKRKSQMVKSAISAIGLPTAAYASLAGTTFGAFKLIAGGTAAASSALPLGFLGFSIGVPVALTSTMIAVQGGPGVAKRMGGVPADGYLVDLARRAADAVGVKPPSHVFEIKGVNEPNAFAASGFTDRSTTVAVTTGLRNLLTRDELSAVLAHECAHLRHRDVARNMHVAIASAGLGGVYDAGRMLLDSSRRSSRGSRKKKDGKSEDSGAGAGLALMGLGLISQGVAHLVQLGASRGAELRADLAAAEAYGAGSLIRALRKIDEAAATRPADLRTSSAGKRMAFAMISDGPSAQAAAPASQASQPGWRRAIGRIGRALRTHPPLDARISALQEAVADGKVRA